MREDHLFIDPETQEVQLCEICDLTQATILIATELYRDVVMKIWGSQYDQSTQIIPHIGQDNTLNESSGNLDWFPQSSLRFDRAQLRKLITDWPGTCFDDEITLPEQYTFRAACISMLRDLLSSSTALDTYKQRLTVTDMTWYRDLIANHTVKWWPWNDLTDYQGLFWDLGLTFDHSSDHIFDSMGSDIVWRDWVVNNLFYMSQNKLPEQTEVFILPISSPYEISLAFTNIQDPVRIWRTDTFEELSEGTDYTINKTTGVIIFDSTYSGIEVKVSYFLSIWGTRDYLHKLQEYKYRPDTTAMLDWDFILDRYEYECEVRQLLFEDKSSIGYTFDDHRYFDDWENVTQYFDNWGQEYRYSSNFISYLWLLSGPDLLTYGLTGDAIPTDTSFFDFDTPDMLADMHYSLAVGAGADEQQVTDGPVGVQRPVSFDFDHYGDCVFPIDINRLLLRNIAFSLPDSVSIWSHRSEVLQSQITYIPITPAPPIYSGRLETIATRLDIPYGSYMFITLTVGSAGGGARDFDWEIVYLSMIDDTPYLGYPAGAVTYSGSGPLELPFNIQLNITGDPITDFNTGDMFLWNIGWVDEFEDDTRESTVTKFYESVPSSGYLVHGSGSDYQSDGLRDYFVFSIGSVSAGTLTCNWQLARYQDIPNLNYFSAVYDSGTITVTNSDKTDIPIRNGATLSFIGDVTSDFAEHDVWMWAASRQSVSWEMESNIPICWLDFHGSPNNDYVEAAITTEDFNPPDSFSAVVHFTPEGTGVRTLLSKAPAWKLEILADDKLYFELNIGSGYMIDSGSYTVSTGLNYGVVAIFDSVNHLLKLYINGSLVNEISCILPAVTGTVNDLYMGLEYITSSNPLSGAIRNVQYYERALDSEEAIDLSMEYSWSLRRSAADVQAWWMFFDGFGIKLTEWVSSEQSNILGATWGGPRPHRVYTMPYLDQATWNIKFAEGRSGDWAVQTIDNGGDNAGWCGICKQPGYGNLLAVSYIKSDYTLIYMKENLDRSWTKETAVSSSSYICTWSDIAVDSLGTVYIVFYSYPGIHQSVLKCAVRDAITGVWTVEDIDNTLQDYDDDWVSKPQLKLSPSDTPHVAYQSVVASGPTALYTPRHAKRVGGVWITEDIDTPQPSTLGVQDLIVWDENNIIYHYAYTEVTGTSTTYKKAAYNGTGWTITDSPHDWTGFNLADSCLSLSLTESVILLATDPGGIERVVLNGTILGDESGFMTFGTGLVYDTAAFSLMGTGLVFYNGSLETVDPEAGDIIGSDLDMCIS